MAVRHSLQRLTPLELEVMNALWQVQSGTVRDVRRRMSRTPPLAYNTVQTVLGILRRKRYVRRRIVGRAFVYEPVESRARAVTRIVRDLADKLFAGSPTDLLMTFVGEERLTRQELRRLLAVIRKHEHDAG